MTVAVMAMLAGLVTFLTISRREDPEMRSRVAVVTGEWPGAPAEKVDELLTDLLESAIKRIDEVDEIRSESQAGRTTINVELDKYVTETGQVWDELRNEIRAIEGRLPSGARTPMVNSNFGDVASLCLTLYQTAPPGAPSGDIQRIYNDRELEVYAELVQDDLEALDSVAGVTLHGIAEERIYLEISTAEWAKLALTPQDLRRALDERNIIAASGQIDTADGRYLVRTTGELKSLEEFGGVVVGTDEQGVPLLLRDLPFKIVRGLQDPISKRVRFLDGDHRAPRAVLLAIEMKDGFNVVQMGTDVDQRLAELRSRRLPPDLDFAKVNDLPRQVDDLVMNFVDNLWQAVLVVLLVAFLMMGWRPAIVMAAAVPLCMITALAVVQFFDVELEQFSIASLIIALGMIVDNAIVVSDQTETLLRQGKKRMEAALEGARSLAVPILTSTLTTVAAFLPLLTIPGSSGEYIRSLPIVVSTTLLVSYFVAMMVTPILCLWILKPKQQTEEGKDGRMTRMYGAVIGFCMRAKLVTMGVTLAIFYGAVSLVPMIGSQFFPGGVRDQFFIDVRLAHGSTIDQVQEVVAQLEDLILDTRVDEAGVDRLSNAYAYLGSGGPRLMLTMDPESAASHYALMVVNTVDANVSAPWAAELRKRADLIPGARIDVRTYVLGPPLSNPVEYRLRGPDGKILREMGERMTKALREVEGSRDPNHNWGNSTYQVEIDIDAQRVQLAGLSNKNVADSLNELISGTSLTSYREGDYTIPVELRLAADERGDLRTLESMYVGAGTQKVPLGSVATIETSWQPAAISRFNQLRAITIGCQVQEGYLSTAVSAAAKPILEELLAELPAGYELKELGEQEASSEGQSDMGSALMVSVALILLVLIAQYNSIAKPLVVLAAAPLALIGALIGLLVSGWPLGFMPMLGIVSLVGVVINNAIILIDFIQGSVAEGTELREAVKRAGIARMKPILLTTLTTVGGMVPLALFGGPMWAGMSYAMIFGLVFSTGLTLLVIPTIYVTFVEWFKMQVNQEEQV